MTQIASIAGRPVPWLSGALQMYQLIYINSKTKSHKRIDDLFYTNDHGVETVVSNDLDKDK